MKLEQFKSKPSPLPKIIFLTLSLFIQLYSPLYSHTLFAAPEDAIQMPNLSTDEQKLAYLLAIKKQIPKLFSDAAQYDIDLYKMLGEESELLTTLKTNPDYVRLFKDKKYHELTVTPPKGGLLVTEKKIKPEAVQAWKDELSGTLDTLKEMAGKPYSLCWPPYLKIKKIC